MNESIIKDLGAVTAYASAVEGGYTGTYEDFCKLEAGFAEAAAEVKANADQVAQDKSAVEELKTQVASSATAEQAQLRRHQTVQAVLPHPRRLPLIVPQRQQAQLIVLLQALKVLRIMRARQRSALCPRLSKF